MVPVPGQQVIPALLVVLVSPVLASNSPPRFILDSGVGSEIVLRLREGRPSNSSILRWDMLNTTSHGSTAGLRLGTRPGILSV